MSSLPRGLMTVREIAQQVDEPKHRVLRILRELGEGTEFEPVGRAGQTLLFNPSVVPYVRARLKALEAAHDGGPLFGGFNENGSA